MCNGINRSALSAAKCAYLAGTVIVFSSGKYETLELSELTVNPGQPKCTPHDFELLKLLGKGGYGKVTKRYTQLICDFIALFDLKCNNILYLICRCF